MCNFNEMDDVAKGRYSELLNECADTFGGKNFFLRILEAIRESKTHPLTEKECKFNFSTGYIKWNKIIFKDKLTLLAKIRTQEKENGNLLPKPEEKNYKNIVNLVRTLKPIEFEIKPKNRKDGEGFKVSPFDVVDEHTTLLNPVFDALFFCPIETVKKILNYEKTVAEGL